jgi:hypothetical protein
MNKEMNLAYYPTNYEKLEIGPREWRNNYPRDRITYPSFHILTIWINFKNNHKPIYEDNHLNIMERDLFFDSCVPIYIFHISNDLLASFKFCFTTYDDNYDYLETNVCIIPPSLIVPLIDFFQEKNTNHGYFSATIQYKDSYHSPIDRRVYTCKSICKSKIDM